MPNDSPLTRAGELLHSAHYESLEQEVAAHGEALRLIHETLVAIADELSRLRRGEPPAGALARY